MPLKLAVFFDPKGQCKQFLEDGGGYCRADGAGLVVMKRLSDTIRDNDRIHSVIQGVL
jgi:acyl transferase domain-containing protein